MDATELTARLIDDITAHASQRYTLYRIYNIYSATVRISVERDRDTQQSLAVVEVLNSDRKWTTLADNPPGNWHHDTDDVTTDINASLGPIADTLLARARAILGPPKAEAPDIRVVRHISECTGTRGQDHFLERHYTIGADTVQIRITRDPRAEQSAAVASVLTAARTWIVLADYPPSIWHACTLCDLTTIQSVLGPVADVLLNHTIAALKPGK